MKKIIPYLLFIVLTILIVGFYYSVDRRRTEKAFDEMKAIQEYAYFDGQIDALRGDLHIREIEGGDWVWVKTPWHSGEEASFTNLSEYKEHFSKWNKKE